MRNIHHNKVSTFERVNIVVLILSSLVLTSKRGFLLCRSDAYEVPNIMAGLVAILLCTSGAVSARVAFSFLGYNKKSLLINAFCVLFSIALLALGALAVYPSWVLHMITKPEQPWIVTVLWVMYTSFIAGMVLAACLMSVKPHKKE